MDKHGSIIYDTREMSLQELAEDLSNTHTAFSEWQSSQKIEAILIGAPLPEVIVSRREKDYKTKFLYWSCRDFLLSVSNFINGRLELTGLTQLPEYNGLNFKDLHFLQQRKFKAKSIRLKVIENADETKIAIINRLK